MHINRSYRGYEVEVMPEDSVGANETILYITGSWYGPEPEVGINNKWFEIDDIRNEDNISVLKYIEDDNWLMSVDRAINELGE